LIFTVLNQFVMRRLFFFFVAIVITISANAQNAPAFNAKDISISWEAIQNNYQNKDQSLNALTITNNGHTALPASGWKLYFNFARDITPAAVSGNATINQINGDLFAITPTATFTEIKPGASERIEFAADAVVNITDGPEGLYLVWDAEPAKGYAIGAYNVLPFSPKYAGLVTPEVIYNENKTITDVPEQNLTKVFPTPVSYKETGGFFSLTGKVSILADPGFTNEVEGLKAELKNLFGKNIRTASTMDNIYLKHADNMGPEAYSLSVTRDHITISATTAAGMFYGIQSLKTLIPASAYAEPQKMIQVPCVEVADQPRFTYRALLLDVARNFQTKQEVLKLLDAMALYKLNIFHFHLTDDEGWRIEIPGLPELTSVGSQRGHTLDSRNFLPASHGSGPDVGQLAGSGYYTHADYVEILKYATARHIMVVPEIESPGHARAAVKAMNARYARLMAEGKPAEATKYLLHDMGDQSEYPSVQAWTDNVIDVSLPSTYTFFQAVTDELISTYKEAGAPLTTIHFGGDEVPAHVWEKSPAYLALKIAHPEIQNTNDLWYYFYGRLSQMLKDKGLSLAGWEEMCLRKTALDGKPYNIPNPDFAYQHWEADVWNNTLGDGQEDLAYKLANGGYKVVLTSVTNLYFDMAHYKSFDEPGYYWGAFVDVDKPFSFIPYDYFKNTSVDRNGLPINKSIFIGKQRLTDYGKANILGLQGCLWGENIKTPQRAEYMIFPNLLGLAERSWAADPQWATETDTAKSSADYHQAWVNFVNILGKRELPRLAYYNGGYDYRIPKPGVILQNGKYLVNMQFPGFTIRYTTNGKDPDAKSKVYNDNATITGDNVKFRAFDNKGNFSNVSMPANPKQ
jgi:hexosaminidase